MTTLTVTAKGQITLRKTLLRHLGVAPGDRLRVVPLADGSVALSRPGGDISRVFGLLKRPRAPPITLEQMAEAIRAGWAGDQ